MSEFRQLLDKMPIKYQVQIENEMNAVWSMKDMAEEDNKRLRAHILALESEIKSLYGYSKIALDILRSNPWPTPNYEVYQPLQAALQQILAIAQPKDHQGV